VARTWPDQCRVQLLRVVGGHDNEPPWSVNHTIQHLQQRQQQQQDKFSAGTKAAAAGNACVVAAASLRSLT
jgi:predicted transcriptional regulator